MSRTVLQECCNSQQVGDDVLARVSHPSLRLKSSPESYVWDHLWNSAVIQTLNYEVCSLLLFMTIIRCNQRKFRDPLVYHVLMGRRVMLNCKVYSPTQERL